MMNIMSEDLSEKKKNLIKALSEVGIKRKTAEVLLCIAENENIKSQEIERKTGLRQPEVSICVQDLKIEGWISEKHVKKEGRGRPENAYSLKADLNNIVSEIEEEKKEEIEQIEQNIHSIKELAEKLYG